jgi:hypothetical protein
MLSPFPMCLPYNFLMSFADEKQARIHNFQENELFSTMFHNK